MDKHVFTDKQKKLIAWAAIAIFLLLSAAVGWFIGRPLVRFASRPEEFRLWVDGHGLLGMAAYVGMVFLQVVVAVIPGEPLEISGGYAFGALRGSVLCLLGGVLGSVAGFALVRRFGRELVEIFFPREKLEKLKFLQSSPKRDALFWLIFLCNLYFVFFPPQSLFSVPDKSLLIFVLCLQIAIAIRIKEMAKNSMRLPSDTR